MSYRSFTATLWDKILEFNKKYWTEPESFNDQMIKSLPEIQVPLLPLKMNPYLFNQLFSIFSKIFTGENGNFIEITYDKSANSINGITLIKSDIRGNFIEFIENPIPDIQVQPRDLANLEQMFISIKTAIFNNYKIDLGSVRIIDTRLFDLIKKITEIDLQQPDFESLMKAGITLLFDLVQYDYVSIYPNLQLLQFAKDLLNRYLGIRNIASELCSIKNILPKGTISITFFGDIWYSTLIFTYDGERTLNIQAIPPFDFGKLDKDNIYAKISLIKRIGKEYSKKYNVQASYLLDPNWLKDIIIDLIESPIPFEESRQNLLLQKVLLALKNVETIWDVYPKPIVYNDLFRYFLRTLGYHISPRKISYWVLPELVSFFNRKYLGNSYNVLFIVSKSIDPKNPISKKDKWTLIHVKQLIQNSFGILISQNANITERIDFVTGAELQQIIDQNNAEISELEQKVILDSTNLYSKYKLGKKISNKNLEITMKSCFAKFRTAFQEKYGILDMITFINQDLIQKIISVNEVETISTNPMKYVKALRSLKNFNDNAEYFCIYPDLPMYQYIKNRGLKISKEILPLFFDFTEF